MAMVPKLLTLNIFYGFIFLDISLGWMSLNTLNGKSTSVQVTDLACIIDLSVDWHSWLIRMLLDVYALAKYMMGVEVCDHTHTWHTLRIGFGYLRSASLVNQNRVDMNIILDYHSTVIIFLKDKDRQTSGRCRNHLRVTISKKYVLIRHYIVSNRCRSRASSEGTWSP